MPSGPAGNPRTATGFSRTSRFLPLAAAVYSRTFEPEKTKYLPKTNNFWHDIRKRLVFERHKKYGAIILELTLLISDHCAVCGMGYTKEKGAGAVD